MRRLLHIVLFGFLALPGSALADTLAERIAPPPDYERTDAADGTFGAWLRKLPLRPGRGEVRLFDGTLKRNQRAHQAVFEVDVGSRDLQQCADAVIRLRADYLFTRLSDDACDDIVFHFTSGDAARWSDWRRGIRPRISGNRASGNSVTWHRSASADDSYPNFRRYLDTVFTYAGTHSLAQELEPVPDPARMEAGDVFIQGGFPGHAVVVVDVAQNRSGERVFLLAQSYMPAQDIHLLRNPGSASPWYEAKSAGALQTPEWLFDFGDLRRFPKNPCAPWWGQSPAAAHPLNTSSRLLHRLPTSGSSRSHPLPSSRGTHLGPSFGPTTEGDVHGSHRRKPSPQEHSPLSRPHEPAPPAFPTRQ